MVRLAGDYKSRGNQAQILGSNSRISSSGLTQTKEETNKFEKKEVKKEKKKPLTHKCVSVTHNDKKHTRGKYDVWKSRVMEENQPF